MRFTPAGPVCRVLGTEQRTLDRWIKEEIITPAIPGPGKGGRHLFSAVDVLAIALARDLRRKGFSLADCASALEALRGRDLAELQREWSAGRTHLLVVMGESMPFLAAADSIRHPTVQAILQGKLWAWIDTATAYAQLASNLDAEAAKERQP